MPDPNTTGASLDPSPQAPAQPGPDNMGGANVAPNGLIDQWGQWMGKPQNRAALMQFGIAMLQPMNQGETGSSHFANAVGSGGQAAETVTKQGQQQKASEDTSTLKEAQANLAGERATHAGDTAALRGESASLRAENAAKGLELKQQGLENTQARSRTMADIAQSNSYNRYLLGATKAASDPLNPSPEPIKTRQQYDAESGYIPGGGAMSLEARSVQPQAQTSGGIPQVKPSLQDWSRSNPAAWNMIRQGIQTKDPRAMKLLEQLRGVISDQPTIDALEKGP